MPNNNSHAQINFLTPFTAFPCVLIDRVMPTLKDTEWRLLCVIVRQTVGWSANGRKHKRLDWLTQRQLMARTGRNSAAISNALNTLVKRRLVDACDEAGNLLLTPQERRRCSGRIYLGLCYAGIEALTPTTSINAKSEHHFAKTAVANTNTTKEIKDNKLPNGKASSTFLKTEATPIEARRFLRHYQSLFRQRTVSGEAPPIIWGRDMKIARELLKQYSIERLITLLEQYFASNDAWYEKCGYSLTCFKSAIPKLLLREGRVPTPSSFRRDETAVRISSGWQKIGDVARRPGNE
jgi:hypothetical protein